MFDFEKLDVYKKAKVFNSGLREFINIRGLDSSTKNRLRRAAFSVVLNLGSQVRDGRGFKNLVIHLEEWGKPDALLIDLNREWLIGYAKFLKDKRSRGKKDTREKDNHEKKDQGLRKSTITKQIGQLRQLVKAVKEVMPNKKLVSDLPEKIKVEGKASIQRMPLEFGDLIRLLNLDKLSPHLGIVRDHFLLMCFTGVRISDLSSRSESLVRGL